MISKIESKPNLAENSRTLGAFNQLQLLLTELNNRELPREVVNKINAQVASLNSSEFTKKVIEQTQTEILTILETNLGLVPKDHYRRKWLALGMTLFGIPMGVVFGLLMGNIGLLGIGLPIGLAIGVAYGSQLDKKASEEGLQLGV